VRCRRATRISSAWSHARHVRVEHGDARLRRHGRGWIALRRQGDRTAQCLLAEFEKIHIDIDPSSINKNVRVEVPIIGDCGQALAALIEGWPKVAPKRPSAKRVLWWKKIGEWRRRECLRYDRGARTSSSRKYALERLHALTHDRDTYITTESASTNVGGAVLEVREGPTTG